MMDDVIRLYENGRFSSIPVPEWFERAVEISSGENLDWHHSVSRALGAEHQGLTINSTGPIGLTSAFGIRCATASMSRSTAVST